MYFEEIGFKYVGPIDGHNLKSLEKALKKAFFFLKIYVNTFFYIFYML